MARTLGNKLIRIRLGHALLHPRQPFTAVPYKVLSGERDFVESSARSRGFKFGLIAGALHFDHLAGLVHSPAHADVLSLNALHLSQSCKLELTDARTRLHRLLRQHETEWKEFMHSLGPNSFVANWAIHAQ